MHPSESKPAEPTHAPADGWGQEMFALEADPRLSSGWLHEFHDVLGAIRAFASLAHQEAADRPRIQEHLDHLMRAAARAHSIIDQVNDLIRHARQKRRPLRPEPVVRGCLEDIRPLACPNVAWSTCLSPDTPSVQVDPAQLHQLLLTLCTNALHALQNRAGQLEVRLEPFEADLAFAQKHPELATGLYARLQVRDTGASPDPELLQRAFDTSLTPREGIDTSELSLRLARTIARQHSGLLTVDCQPQAGNVCSVYLPAHLEFTTGIPQSLPRGSGERVLFVDDEQDCCQATEQLLRHLGFEPVAHTNPQAALEDFRSRPHHFDAAVLDLNMPALTGVDLATLMLELRPDLPVYIATGYSGLWTPEMAINLGIRGILAKPVAAADWLRALKEALAP